MDDFVRDKLTEWNLSEWIEIFKDQGIDTESFHCLDDQDIKDLIPTVGPRSKYMKRFKLLMVEQNTANPESVELSAQGFPSTSGIRDKEKRRLDLQEEFSQWQPPPRKPRLEPNPEEKGLSEVKDIMILVDQKIPKQDNKLNNVFRSEIHDLETDKREAVGVFGKTEDEKSFLTNTVIGEKNLVPIGGVSACTSAVIIE